MDPLTALAIVGTVMTVSSAASNAQAQEDAANYNAQLADRNAAIARDQTAREEEMQRRENKRRMGSIRAGYAASGVSLSEGSPLDVLAESASQAELDVQTIKYRGKLRELGYNEDAALSRNQASNARRQGTSAMASALLTGAGNVYNAYTTSKNLKILSTK